MGKTVEETQYESILSPHNIEAQPYQEKTFFKTMISFGEIIEVLENIANSSTVW